MESSPVKDRFSADYCAMQPIFMNCAIQCVDGVDPNLQSEKYGWMGKI